MNRAGLSFLALVVLGLFVCPCRAGEPKADDALPEGAVARLGSMALRGRQTLISVALSPDGMLVAARDTDGRIYLWQRASGKSLHQFKVVGEFGRVVFSNDGKRLFDSSVDPKKPEAPRRQSVWDIATGKPVTPTNEVTPGGPRRPLVALGGGYSPVILDDETGEQIETPGKGSLPAAISADGARLACVPAEFNAKTRVLLIQRATGKVLGSVPPCNIFEFPAAAFSPDGRTLVIGSLDRLTFADSTTGRVLSEVRAETWARFRLLAYLPDGRLLSYGCGGKLCFWDTAKNEVIRTIEAGSGAAALSGDGRLIAVTNGTTVRLWQTDTGKELSPRPAGPSGQLIGLTIAPGGRHLVALDHMRGAWLWDVKDGSAERIMPMGVAGVAFSPNGRTLALSTTQPAEVTLRDVVGGTSKRLLTGRIDDFHHLAFSADGNTLLTLGRDEGAITNARALLQRFDARTGRALGQTLPSQRTLALGPYRLSRNGHFVAFVQQGALEPELCLVNTRTGAVDAQIRHDGGWYLTISADGQAVASGGYWSSPGGYGHVRVCESAGGGEVLRVAIPARSVEALALSDDGRWLATADCDFDVSGLGGIPRPEKGAAMPEGAAVATPTSERYTIRLWDVAAGRELKRFEGGLTKVGALAFTPDGSRLASALGDGTVLFWDVASVLKKARASGPPLAADEFAALWDTLIDPAPAKANRAMARLSVAPAQAIELMRSKLQPEPLAQTERLKHLIAQLDSSRFKIREAATVELRKLRDRLAVAVELPADLSLEARRRLEAIFSGSSLPRGEGLRAARAVRTLAWIDTTESRRLLQELAAGADGFRLTLEARHALERRAVQPAKRP